MPSVTFLKVVEGRILSAIPLLLIIKIYLWKTWM